jgi:WD40 repeat protein
MYNGLCRWRLYLALVGLCWTAHPSPARDVAEGDEQAVRRDSLGDPLPPGAVLRIGTTRLRHVESIRSLTFSPDGKTLVSAGRDAVRAWDVATGKELPPFGKEGKGAQCATFLPKGKILAAGYDDEIVLWDVARRQPVRRLKDEKFERGASFLAVASDGKTLAATNPTRGLVIQLWQVETGRVLGELRGIKRAISSLSLSPDGRFLVASSGLVQSDEGDSEVTLWEVPEAKPKWQAKIPAGFSSVSFSPDGKTVAVGTSKGPVRYLRADTGEQVKAPEVNGRLVAMTPDGKTLALSRADRTVRLCDAATGRERHCLRGHGSEVSCLAFSSDGKVLASGCSGSVILWETASGRELHPFAGHRVAVAAVAFSPDGRSLVSRGGDQTIRVWDLASGKETLRLDAGSRVDWSAAWNLYGGYNPASSLAYSSDGKLLATWDARRRSILVWDARTGKQRFELKGHHPPITALAFFPDGKRLASCGHDCTVRLWDMAEGKQAKPLVPGVPPDDPDRWAECVLAISPDGKRLALYTFRGVEVWDVATANRLSTVPPPAGATSLVFYQGGEMLAVARPHGPPAIRLVGATAGREVRSLTWESKNRGSGSGLLSLALSPDGRYLASANGIHSTSADQADWDIRVWNLLTGQQILHFGGHRSGVNGVAFSPDGRRLASASSDGTVLVWDLLALPKDRQERLRKGLDAEALDRLWSDLAGDEPQRAFQTMALLSRAPDKAVPLIRSRLQPVAKGEHKNVAALIADLNAGRFAVREAASRALRALGAQVEADLQRALAERPPAETRRRLQELLDHCRTALPAPDVRRQERALTVLEWVGSQQAREVLQGLGRGDPKAQLTRQAHAALRRLDRRSGEQ